MPRLRSEPKPLSIPRSDPAINPEDRENQLISLAIDLAEQQLRDGTASAQVITHYLKLGSTREKLEKQILEEQKGLLHKKAESYDTLKSSEELYKKAIDAFNVYSGHDTNDED